MSCSECLAEFFHQSPLAKDAACRSCRARNWEPPGIYAMQRGVRDIEFSRRPELEQQLLSQVNK